MSNSYDVIIIGAGPAGTLAAAKLLKEGKTVMILEKIQFPRFVIGESLLPQCMDYLDDLDLLPCIEEQKFQVKTGVCFYHENSVCDFLFEKQYSDGWSYTWQVKRANFDHALATEVEKRGAVLHYQAEVIDVKTSSTTQTVSFLHPELGSQTATCKFVLDASGYGRVLPRMFDLEVAAPTPPRSAIFVHLKDVNRSEKAGRNIFVHSFNENTAWIWSIPFADGTTSVGIVGNTDFVNECAEDQGAMFHKLVGEFPGLDNRYQNVPLIFEPRIINNYAISVKQMYGEGYALCGNSTEFLDPIFSSGVTFAVSSGYKSAALAVKQLNGEKVDWENEYSIPVKKGIDVFRSYVNAWYEGDLATIFFANDRRTEFMEQICSVLAGYVWDETNPFVKKHKTLLKTLAKVIRIEESRAV